MQPAAAGGVSPYLGHRGINHVIRLGGRGCGKLILRDSERRQGNQRGRREQRGPHGLSSNLPPDLDWDTIRATQALVAVGPVMKATRSYVSLFRLGGLCVRGLRVQRQVVPSWLLLLGALLPRQDVLQGAGFD